MNLFSQGPEGPRRKLTEEEAADLLFELQKKRLKGKAIKMSKTNAEAEMLATLRDVIDIGVRAGFASRAEVINFAVDCAVEEDKLSPEIEKFIREETALYFQAHYAEQRFWPETDCDRLDEAFAELDRVNILTFHNFMCCQTCGHNEIANWVEDRTRGYVFYHQQDTESVVRKGYLYLAYGAVSGKEKESLQIAEEACEILRKHGLEVDWNGTVRTRICVRNISWKRRRVKAMDYDG